MICVKKLTFCNSVDRDSYAKMKDFFDNINFYKVMVHRISPWGKAMMTVICQMWGKFTPDRGEDRVRKPKYLNQKN